MQKMIIANRLTDGAVVFLAADGGWTPAIADGRILETDQEVDDAHALAKRHEMDCIVIDPLPIDVAVRNGRLRPTAIREAIRAFGPTIRTDLAGDSPEAVEAWH